MNTYSVLCGIFGICMGSLGNFTEGEIYCKKGLHIASKIHDLRTLAQTESYYGILYATKGDGQLAIEHLQKSFEYFKKVNWVLGVSITCAILGFAYQLIGDLETARKYLEKGIKIQSNTGIELYLSWLYFLLGKMFIDSGDLNKARSNIETALKLSQKNIEREYEGLSMIYLGRILGKTGKLKRDVAIKFILEGIKILDQLGTKPALAEGYFRLGELYADYDQKEMALEKLKKAEEMFREMDMNYWLAKTQKVLTRL